jgi:2-deoxy-D-gluconate 3-dehydrogenase
MTVMGHPFDLTGKIAVITGANTGIGQAIAIALAEAGAGIVAVGRSPAEETARRIAPTGAAFHEIRADLSVAGVAPDVVAQAIDRAGRVDILVNNAGIIRRADAIDFTEADWDDVMNVNLKSVFFLSQAVARHMLADGRGGKIINIASLLSFQGGIRVPSYTASKSGLVGLTRLLACEWAGRGINVNAIAPKRCATTRSATPRSWRASQPGSGANRSNWAGRPCFWRRRPPIMSTVSCCRSMAAGWRGKASALCV